MPNRDRRVYPRTAVPATALLLVMVLSGCTGEPPLGVREGNRLAAGISGDRARMLVDELAPLLRLPGTPGYDRALEIVAARLHAGGFVPLESPPNRGGTDPGDLPPGYTRVLEDSLRVDVWYPLGGRLEVTGAEGFTVADTDEIPLSLARNSRPTPPGGLATRLYNLGNGTYPQDYAGINVRGAIVYGRRPLADIYRAAVLERGAAGAVSAAAPGWQDTGAHPELVPAGVVGREGFGFTMSVDSALRLERAVTAAGGSVPVRAVVDARYLTGRVNRTLIAAIPGTGADAEGVAIIAPLSGPAPGASDVSGAAAQVEAALSLLEAIREGRLEHPQRTLIFIWGAAGMSVNSWARQCPEVVENLHSATVLQLVGARTAGAEHRLLIERYPDPSAIWTRPPESHTPWGAAPPPYWPFEGHYLSELTAEVGRSLDGSSPDGRIGTTPYEGGSEHTSLLEAGIPAQRIWSFPDPLYRSQLDTPDHLDPALMSTAALLAATTAYITARADRRTGERLLTLLYERAGERLEAGIDTARRNLEAGRGDRFLEEDILNAWKAWYLEAIESVLAQPPPDQTGRLRVDVPAAVRRLEERWDEAMIEIGLAPVPPPRHVRPDLPGR